MRICLVSPPTVTDFEDPAVAESDAVRLIAEHAPIGILSLAAVLDAIGLEPRVVDLNRLYYEYLRSDHQGTASTSFGKYVTDYFETLSFDLFGFSTICSSYPLTLRLAEEIKKAHREATVVLGGPQATVVDVQTLRAFPFVDFIVRGEAEETFPLLLDALGGRGSLDALRGITFTRGDDVVRNPNAEVIKDLDQLPLPAFHLYPHMSECRYVPLELGRGCPFACSFCSTNDFFRRRFRLKSPQRVIGEMQYIHRTYGITTFDLIHDMFTVNRSKVVEFCEALLDSGEKFHWNCSARTDCIDDPLIELMASAGCKGIFFGIETGSPRMQKVIKKRLDLSEAALRIRCTDQHGITTAVSLIVGFPDEQMKDLRETVDFLVDSLRFDHAQPQLHLLAPLAETPIHYEYRDELILDDIYSDMSYQGWRQDPIDRDMIAAHPEIFPNFYAVPTPGLDRRYLKEMREFILNGMARFRWLLVALHQESGSLVDVFDEWLRWLAAGRDGQGPRTDSCATPYYATRRFCQDFVQFLASRYLENMDRRKLVISALAEFEIAFGGLGEDEPARARASRPAAAEDPEPLRLDEVLRLDAIPYLARGVRVAELPMDYVELIRCLREKGPLDKVPSRSLIMVGRRLSGEKVEFLQLSHLSGQLLRLCDGLATVSDIARRFSSLGEEVDGIAPEKTCVFGLEMLRQQGVIVASPRPVRSRIGVGSVSVPSSNGEPSR
jgi:radical SAM superfamily enzyme YgiQ (UPF0313 family)